MKTFLGGGGIITRARIRTTITSEVLASEQRGYHVFSRDQIYLLLQFVGI